MTYGNQAIRQFGNLELPSCQIAKLPDCQCRGSA